jgi:Rrf2 family cysteine metabolism transcriptional repressor
MELSVRVQIVVQLKQYGKKIKNSIDSVMNSITLQDIMDDYKAIKDKKSGIKITDRSE